MSKKFPLLTTTLYLIMAITTDTGFTQPNSLLYDDSNIPDIHIFIDPDSLEQILAPENEESDHEYPATFVFQTPIFSDTVENVGFRIRGNTSRRSQKKSFKISFNTFERGRKYFGVEKLNINSQQNDPTIIRTKLCFDIFEKMQVPASRANHVRLFINSEYRGLYINTEHIDENFVQTHYGNNDGNLFKCVYPADLDYLDNDAEAYKYWIYGRQPYALKTNRDADDYSDLAAFIVYLKITSVERLEEVLVSIFDINTFLRYLAVDVAVGSWDNYWFLKNNFYLYHNAETDKWHFIPYDYDNTFGINWIDWVDDWGTRDIYNWGNVGGDEVRPLVTQILSVQKFRDRYSYYLNQLLNTAFHPDSLFPRIDSIHAAITNAAEADTFRTKDFCFNVNDFHNSFNEALNGQLFGLDCSEKPLIHLPYGIKPYVETRRNSALAQLELNNISPILEEISYSPQKPQVGDVVTVRVRVEDDDPNPVVKVLYEFNGVSGEAMMYDDGLHNDGAASDLGYAGNIPAQSERGNLLFYVQATDATEQSDTLPFNGQQNQIGLTVGFDVPGLFINEFMASNDSTIQDNEGGYADWVEIYNGDSVAIWLGDKFLTDNLGNPDKWAFPDTTLEPGAVLLIWADNDTEQGTLHTDYRLSASGEQLGIFRQNGDSFFPVDTLSFGQQETDISYGRNPDGGDVWQFFENPTPGKLNAVPVGVTNDASIQPFEFSLNQNYPNPFNPVTKISYNLKRSGLVSLKVYDVLGREVKKLISEHQTANFYSISFDATALVSGVYFYRLEVENRLIDTKKMLLLR